MMRKGFIASLLFLIIVIGIAVALYMRLLKLPPEKTQKTAESIFKYTQATSWEIIHKKSPCFYKYFQCQSQSQIHFETTDAWPTIYSYYRTYMGQYGWTTNSTIITSIPSGIVFIHQNNCQAYITKESTTFINKFLERNQTEGNTYTISVSCPD